LRIPFRKYEALGNDFVLVEVDLSNFVDIPNLAKNILHRNKGIGGDGFLLISPSKVAQIRMRYFNPDGSEAEICGNGLRCVGFHYLLKKNKEEGEIEVECQAGIFKVKVRLITPFEAIGTLTMSLKKNFEKISIQLEGRKIEGYFSCEVGNPHFVVFGDIPQGEDFKSIGSGIENAPVFKERTNVNFVEILNRRKIYMRPWERGVGETKSCVTGAIATWIVGSSLGILDEFVEVISEGGKMTLRGGKEIEVESHIRFVFEGIYNFEEGHFQGVC